MQDEQDKWKNGGEQAFLRSRLRCVTAESYEAVRRVREELITVHETVKKQMYARYSPLVSTVKSERDELQRQLAAARAELAAERERANTAEASVIHLRARLELEKAAYVSKAGEAKDAKQERLSVVKQAKLTEKELKNERETKANMEAEFLKRSEDAAAQARAAAFAEASELAESRFSQQVRGLKHDLTSAKEAADEASKALRKATQKGPKVYTDDEIDELTNNAQRQVRFKERKFFRWLVEGRKWRMANIVGTMKDLSIEQLA